jgi:putative flavoprotein involved in K+ transport
MTQTLDPTGTAAGAADTPGSRVDAWLADFQQALTARDVDRVVELFAPTCFWRDLVSFT